MLGVQIGFSQKKSEISVYCEFRNALTAVNISYVNQSR